MNYQVENAEKSTVKITITFTPEEWNEAINKAYQQNRGKYAVNGFRKGKVPKNVLEMYYGKGLFYEDALNILYGEHYGAILDKEKDNFTAVGDPSLSVDDISDEKVVLIADVPVKPDVEIETYKGIKIPEFVYTVSDADVDKDIEDTRLRLAKDEDVTDRAAEMTDTVNIDFAGKMDGKAFDGGTAEGYDLTLGSHQFIPGFEEGVVGMNIGETRDIEVTFPEDYQAEELKGKKAVFTVTLHKITGKVRRGEERREPRRLRPRSRCRWRGCRPACSQSPQAERMSRLRPRRPRISERGARPYKPGSPRACSSPGTGPHPRPSRGRYQGRPAWRRSGTRGSGRPGAHALRWRPRLPRKRPRSSRRPVPPAPPSPRRRS